MLALPASAAAQCPGNLLVNPGFEEGEYKTEGMGTSLSSAIGNGWTPWSILGDATINREVEYKTLHISTLESGHTIRSGARSQKFFTTYGSHTAGFYQRVQVPRGAKVTFSIWVLIYTGERDLESNGHPISDLEWPTQDKPNRGPGNYRASVGIDPYGDVPPGFGSLPSSNTVWSGTINEFDVRHEVDGIIDDHWAQLTVSTIAQGDYVTVYTRGMPEYPVKHNDSFWDDACLYSEAPPAPTAAPTNTPTETPIATETPVPTETPLPTEIPPATETPLPTDTPEPTMIPEPTATEPPPPTAALEPPTAAPATATPESVAQAPTTEPPPAADPEPTPADAEPTPGDVEPTPAPEETGGGEEETGFALPCGLGLVGLYGVVALIGALALAWVRMTGLH